MKTVFQHKGLKTVFVLLSCMSLTLLAATTAFSVSTIAVSPDPVNNFNVVNLGSTSLEQILTINNSGDTALNVSSMSMSGGEFFFDPGRGANPCASSSPVIPPGGSCTMCVVLSPVSEGAKSGVLTIDSDAQNQPSLDLDLSGEGSLQQEFSDVSDSNWAEDYIQTLYYNGITSGYGDGTYRPSLNVDRAQMAVYIIRALEGDPTEECASDPFTDVPASHWACKYIKRISDLGISSGYGDGTYRPNNLVTRAEMAVYVIRALEGDPTEECASDPFSDLGISSGYGDATYRPNNLVTRAQMAVYITKGFLVFVDYPEIDVAPLSHDFGDVIEGNTSAQQVFTISNTGTADLDITDISLSGTDSAEFTLDLNGGSTPCGAAALVLSAGNSCTVSSAFSPSTTGGKNANLNVSSNDPETPAFNAPLTGNGTSQVQYTLIVNKDGDGAGTVTSSPAGIDCGGDCAELYGEGTIVTLTATPAPGSYFFGWLNIGCVGTGPCQFTMNADANPTAVFRLEGGGGGGGLNYRNIPLTYNGVYYSGSFYGESIGPNRAQNFYAVTRPAACTTHIDFQLAGNIANYVNANILISDDDYGTTQDAMSDYLHMLNTYGYLNPYEIFYNNSTYWFYFMGNPAAEVVDIEPPDDSVYYIQVVNEENETGYYNIKVYCW
jgi:hypothetical protein